jgi:hypothetical protein
MGDWSLPASEDNMNIVQVSWRWDAGLVKRSPTLVGTVIRFTFT